MSDFERLVLRFAQTPFLVCNQEGEVMVLSRPEMKRVLDASDLETHVVMNLQRGLRNFYNLAKGKTEYTIKEVAQVAGVAPSAIYFWVKERAITPSVKVRHGGGRGNNILFNWADAIAAGVMGSLTRQGASLETLSKIQPLFTEKKRIGKKVQASSRS